MRNSSRELLPATLAAGSVVASAVTASVISAVGVSSAVSTAVASSGVASTAVASPSERVGALIGALASPVPPESRMYASATTPITTTAPTTVNNTLRFML